MIYIYYHVVSIDDYKSQIRPYYEEAKKFGVVAIVQKRNQPEYFMEVISAKSDVGAQLKGLSELRINLGITKLLLNRKIHVEIFDKLFDDEEEGLKSIV